MEFILSLVTRSIEQVGLALLHNWPYLLVSVVVAALLKLYVNAEKISAFLNRYRGAGVVAATAAAVGTPLCSCGTTAVVLGMMASTMPWAPIVAFMVASPLTSPEGLVYSAGLFGWPFALAFYLASILLGLAGGWVAAALESRGWLANQTRFAGPVPATQAACACSGGNQTTITPGRVFSLEIPAVRLDSQDTTCGCAIAVPIEPAAGCGCPQVEMAPGREEPGAGCACGPSGPAQRDDQVVSQKPGVSLATFLKELILGGKNLAVMFVGFAFVGYFLNGLIPASWVTTLFGGGSIYNVPLAATLGLPFYINSEASLPLIRALLDAGMSQGAALAFLIAGSGTSIGAITGALTIARWRVVVLVVGVLWAGAILSGFALDLALALKVI
jgi:uncharacterized membrane protein YraQ (UPF0718 family)